MITNTLWIAFLCFFFIKERCTTNHPKTYCARFRTHYCACKNALLINRLRSGISAKRKCLARQCWQYKKLERLLIVNSLNRTTLRKSDSLFQLRKDCAPKASKKIVNDHCVIQKLGISECNNKQKLWFLHTWWLLLISKDWFTDKRMGEYDACLEFKLRKPTSFIWTPHHPCTLHQKLSSSSPPPSHLLLANHRLRSVQ